MLIVVAHNQKLDACPLSPGCDYFTRSVRGPFIDTGVDIDARTPMGDRIYVSEATVGTWAQAFGWISPGSAETLLGLVEKHRIEVQALREEVARLTTIERALLAGGFQIPTEDQIPEPEITEFPHLKGGGWWLFSDGSTIRCTTEEAAKRQDEIDAQAEVEVEVEDREPVSA